MDCKKLKNNFEKLLLFLFVEKIFVGEKKKFE